ncbi:MAG: hypothetical protein M3R36_17250 [Bacteroidota bacterium]|nr:hypothetical protein [Bacteroidota bacterium]
MLFSRAMLAISKSCNLRPNGLYFKTRFSNIIKEFSDGYTIVNRLLKVFTVSRAKFMFNGFDGMRVTTDKYSTKFFEVV